VLALLALVATAAGAGFAFDEEAGAVIEVAPRGAWWRRSSRLAVAAVPLATWLLVVQVGPDSPLTGTWTLVGAVCVALATGTAALLSRVGLAAPGSPVAAGTAVVVLTPPVIGPLAGWTSLLPPDGSSTEVVDAWRLLGVAAVVLITWAVRPGLR